MFSEHLPMLHNISNSQNPRNFSALRKASILLAVTYVMLLSSVSATSVGVMSEWGTVWFGVSPLEYEITLTIYLVPMALASLVLAPLSELYGRRFIYRTTTIMWVCLTLLRRRV